MRTWDFYGRGERCRTTVESPASNIADWFPEGHFDRRAIIGLVMDLTAVMLIYSPWGKRSVAHLNPAVTLSFLRMGKINCWDVFFYSLFQVIGGAMGILSAASATGNPSCSDRIWR